jgi:hypothetical protein
MSTDGNFPVLDDNSSDGMVLAFAADAAEAEGVGRAYATRVGMAFSRVDFVWGVCVTYDPDINQHDEAERANACGCGWVVVLADGEG